MIMSYIDINEIIEKIINMLYVSVSDIIKTSKVKNANIDDKFFSLLFFNFLAAMNNIIK